jgi:hypothetical protein
MQRSPSELVESMNMLESNLWFCHPYDCFGHDNRVKIQAMLEVIQMDRSKVWINSRYLNADELMEKNPDNVMWRAAMDARNWLDGEFELEELLFSEREIPENAEMLADVNTQRPGWLAAAITAAQ